MVSMLDIKQQLRACGFSNVLWGSSAIRELPNILANDEVIQQAMSGTYDAGHALLIATNRRLLFLDKKPFSFVVEDVPYDMISEVEYTVNLLNTKVNIHCISKDIGIATFNGASARRFVNYVEDRVAHLRAHVNDSWNKAVQYRASR